MASLANNKSNNEEEYPPALSVELVVEGEGGEPEDAPAPEQHSKPQAQDDPNTVRTNASEGVFRHTIKNLTVKIEKLSREYATTHTVSSDST